MARTFYETAPARRRRRGDLRARPQRADLHVPAADGLRDVVLAGAIAAGWRHPVFIQGDHYQFNAKKYAADPEAMTEEIRRACRLAIDAGYRNIDIDSSTLVDLSKPDRDEQQRENYVRAAELTALIREPRDRRRHDQRRRRDRRGGQAELDGRRAARRTSTATTASWRRRAPGAVGPVEGQRPDRARRHGGVPLPGGGVAEVKLDFEVLRDAGRDRARSYGLAGAVQHGASTLPDELFHHFPAVETAEIHLATGFQNALYEHPAFPAALHRRDLRLVRGRTPPTSARTARPRSSSCTRPARRRSGRSSGSCGTSTRKDEILAAQGTKLAFLFTELRVNGSLELVERYVQPVPLSRPIPEALTAAVPG